jgi:hypothetical protein
MQLGNSGYGIFFLEAVFGLLSLRSGSQKTREADLGLAVTP